jgi:putative oxidoreductase
MNFIVNLLILLPARIASYFAWAGPLIMRLIVGYVFMMSGWGKLNNLPQITENFTEWGIIFPKIMTPFVSGVEFFGGIMLILGLFTRIPAAMLAFTMLVAIKSAKWDQVDSLETLLGGGDLFRRFPLACDRRPRHGLARPAAAQCRRRKQSHALRLTFP